MSRMTFYRCCWLAWAAAGLWLVACHESGGGENDAAGGGGQDALDGAQDATGDADEIIDGRGDAGDAGQDDGGDEGPGWSRGIEWTRTHPMFLSGLTVFMGQPPAWFVSEYFEDFHATAVHLWQNGLPIEMNGWAAAGQPLFRWVSWVLPDGTSSENGQVAGGYGADPAGRIGYQISDEPGNMDGLLAFQAGIDALRANDPEALLVVNFLASGTEEMVDYYAGSMGGDVISYDRYDRSNDCYEALALFRRQGLAHGLPYWRYMNSFMFSDREDVHHESDMRWDAFSGLTFGYTGHTWFLYQIAGSPDLVPLLFENDAAFDAPKTAHWVLVAQINAEMRNLGRAITQLTSTDVRYVPTLDIYLPPGLSRWEAGAGGDLYITGIECAPQNYFLEFLVGVFRDDTGEIYVMIQNVRHEHGDFPIDRHDAGTVRVSFDFSAAPPACQRSSLLTLNKLTGQVESLPMTSVQGDLATLDVTLAAGDPILFKYDDGAAFALGP